MSAIKLDGCSTPEQIASLGLTAIREIFPTRETESELAVRLRIEMLSDIVREVGPERFMAAVKKAITMSHNRFDCTIRRIRECAGVAVVAEPAPAYKAWQFVTEIVHRHVRRWENGWRLEPWYTSNGTDVATVTEVPPIPEPIKRAVQAIGGWGMLAACDPQYWPQRMKDFVNLYEE